MKSSTFLLFFSYLLFCMQPFHTKSYAAGTSLSYNETDKLALLALKDHITEDPLGVMSSWNGSVNFCQWIGVSCSRRHRERVTSLRLINKQLVGSIPPHVGNLSFLRNLDIEGNFFRGMIPQEIGNLFRLRHLLLRGNEIEGTIPTKFSNLSELVDVDLTYNKVSGEIPSKLGSLSKLEFFSVYSNNLTGIIPRWFGNISSLQIFSITRNNLQGSIPFEFGRLPRLSYLQISENNLTGIIPTSIYNRSSLFQLSVAYNNLHGIIPHDIGTRLHNLRTLYLSHNQFTGTIPASLPNASRLQVVTCNSNRFTGSIPPNIGHLSGLTIFACAENHLTNADGDGLRFLTSLTNCSNLTTLTLARNNFKGELPASLANLSQKLQRLEMDSNRISGSIPKEINNLIGLRYLKMSRNLLTGELPASFGGLEKIERILLPGNKISGTIPSSIGNLSELSVLSLDDNHFEGNIPSTLGNCRQLLRFSLSKNFLFGNLPKEVSGIPSMVEFLVNGNLLTGRLPLEVGNMTKLSVFEVSDNKFTGGIPSTLGRCIMLERLEMRNNLLEGRIPPSFEALKSLHVFEISKNNLSGKVPEYLQNFTFLQYLNLSFNNFEGDVPHEGVFKNASAVSLIGNAKLCSSVENLGLPKCQVSKKKRTFSTLTLVYIIVPSLFLLAFLLVISFWRRKARTMLSPMLTFDQRFPMVSYAELHQATNGFSESELIGQGTHGCVYRGIMGSGEEVAVKVFNLKQRGAFKSFTAECAALREIRHRNLLKIITVCSSIDSRGEDFKVLVYEFMQNGNLEDHLHLNDDNIEVGRLSFTMRLDIIFDVASAIEYLHYHCQTSIVHGDLKPSNVLLDANMTAHVGDFGLAKFLPKIPGSSGSNNQTSSLGIQGTVGYVAPEYGFTGKASMAGDVYSFGILLLEMFTGKRPTDVMFKDNLTLHEYASMALPERVMDIVAPTLQSEIQCLSNGAGSSSSTDIGILKDEEYLVRVLRIGLMCSMEVPKNRMKMSEVVAELFAIRQKIHLR